MFIEYNPNPVGRRVDDCAIRAIAKALDWDWEKAYAVICSYGFAMGDMPHSNSVWGALLREQNFVREIVPNTCPDCYTAQEFAEDHPEGTYVLSFNRHVATMIDGNLYDTWNSLEEPVQYYWRKKEGSEE